MNFQKWLNKRLRIDTRSLAVFRIFAGVLIVIDLLLRTRNFHYFYTEDGVVPLSVATKISPDYAFSVYHLTADTNIIISLFIFQALVALALTIGFKTKTATALSFIFIISLNFRNTFILSYADFYFRVLLFWAIFLPLGERWSVDAIHSNQPPRENIASIASGLILFQVVFVYLRNGVLKVQSEMWRSGEAVPLIMGRDHLTFLLGEAMSEFPTLLRYGGILWLYMLLFSWLLIVLQGRKRTIFTGMFITVHGILAVTLRIGIFSFVAFTGLVLFLQADFWEYAKRALGDNISHLRKILLSMSGVAEYLPKPYLGSEMSDKLKVYINKVGVVLILIVGFMFLATFLVHLPAEVGESNEEIRKIAEGIGVGGDAQKWAMYAPNPGTVDRYYVYPAETKKGEKLDIYNQRPLTYERPYDQLQKQYQTYRERLYMTDLEWIAHFTWEKNPPMPAHKIFKKHTEYICESWSKENQKKLTHVNIYLVMETITIETVNSPSERKRSSTLLYRHGCGDNKPKIIQQPGF